jgi:hypothetical protein
MEKPKILDFQSKDEVSNNKSGASEFTLPQRAFFTLKEACHCKNLNYKTACNRPILQPNSGIADGKVGGRKVWRYATIASWVSMTDDELNTDKAS